MSGKNLALSKSQRRTVAGAGINDADYVVDKVVNGKRRKCIYYETWKGMLARCNPEGHMQKRIPTYKGCKVCEDWLFFSNFKKWMESQDWEGKQLDKDLRSKGEMIYSPETCIFVPRKINMFMSGQQIKTKLPVGVSYHEKTMKYRAKIKRDGRLFHIGCFNTQREAHIAYLETRASIAIEYSRTESADVARALNEYAERICGALKCI